MKGNNDLLFSGKAFIGRILAESFFKKMGKRLQAKINQFQGTVTIEWVHIGSGDRETLLFLHGFSDRKESFYFTADTLSDDFDIIMPDMPGFGQSTKNPCLEYSLDHYVDWLGEFIEHLPTEKFHLAGNSMGGAVSTKLAVRYPEKVQSLILIDSLGFFMPNWESILDDALEGKNLFYVESAEDYEKFRDRIFYKKPKTNDFVLKYLIKEAMDNKEWYNKVFNELVDLNAIRKDKKAIDDISLNALLPKITVPTLILWGRHDAIFPYQISNFIHEHIQNSKVRIFEDVGHCPHFEVPQELAKEISNFLKQ